MADGLFAFLQKEEERLRASIRRESQQRRMREKQHQRGLSASYLEPDRYDEEEEGEESVSLAAIKNRYKGGIRGEWGVKPCHVCSPEHALTLDIALKSRCY